MKTRKQQCGKTYTGCDEYSQKTVQLELSTNANKVKPVGTNTRKKWYNSNHQQMRKNLKPVGTNTRKKWYNSNCQQMRKNLKPIGTNTRKKWYNSNCQQMRKTVNRLGQILTKNPYNHFLKGQCFNLKGRYKTTCKI